MLTLVNTIFCDLCALCILLLIFKIHPNLKKWAVQLIERIYLTFTWVLSKLDFSEILFLFFNVYLVIV